MDGMLEYKDAIKLIEGADDSKITYEVFTDFVKMIAISISSAVDISTRERREEQYKTISSKYTPESLSKCAEFLGMLTILLQVKREDVLGTMYMMLDFGDKSKAQEFTPFSITQIASRIAILDKDESKNIDINIFVKGYVSVNDCSCGAGSMIIGYAMMLKSFGYNYQRHLLAFAEDLDEIAVAMTYIQLSLLGIPAIVRRQDTLTEEVFDTWFTPAFIAQSYRFKDEFKVKENKIKDKEEIICKTKEAKQLELNV